MEPMPEQLEDPSSRETTKPSRMKRLANKLGERFFPNRQKRAPETYLNTLVAETRLNEEGYRKAYAELVEKGFKPGTIEWWTMPEGGRSLEEYERKLMFSRDELAGKVVLDLGAGPTLRFANEIEASGVDAKVISLSADFSDEKYRGTAQEHSNGAVVAGLAQALPFKDGSFDEIFGLHIAEHLLTEDIRRAALHEVARVLKGGGTARIGTLEPGARFGRLALYDEELSEYFRSVGVEANLVPHDTIQVKQYDDRTGMAFGYAPAGLLVIKKDESAQVEPARIDDINHG